MHTFRYDIGSWHAEALLEQMDPGKLLAVISVTNRKGRAGTSRHTVVFEHEDGLDMEAETEALVRRLLGDRYGL
jgi:hypothetical protein